MKLNLLSILAAATLLTAIPGWAGPPLVCHPIDIGKATSLPWNDRGNNWNGTVSSYDLSKLTGDTLNLLVTGASLPLRMETLRRAAIYSAKDEKLMAEITARLTARVLDAEAAGHAEPQVWFDAGYWIETLRQASFIYRYNMLTPAERTQWKNREGAPGMDGWQWVQKAVRMGGKGMDQALSSIREYREADLRAGRK